MSRLRIFGDAMQFSSGAAGIHLAVKVFPAGTAVKMISAAGCCGLTLRGSYQLDESVPDHLLVLGYGGVQEAEIEPAVLQLRRLYDAVAVDSTVE